MANNKGAEEPVPMRRLICTFVVRIVPMRRLICTFVVRIVPMRRLICTFVVRIVPMRRLICTFVVRIVQMRRLICTFVRLCKKQAFSQHISFQFTSGLISKDAIADLDFILATPDNMTALTTLRSTLRERLPKLGNNTLHVDLRFLLEKYTKGVLYDIKKPTEETGQAQIPFGKVLTIIFEHHKTLKFEQRNLKFKYIMNCKE